MPLPPINTAPYDILDTVLNTARVRMNDAIQDLGGDILRDDQPFTQTMANSAWRKMQEYLQNFGFTRVTDEIIIEGLPVVASQDPASQCWLSWTGYSTGGVNEGAINPNFVLPQTFIFPLKIWERITGQNAWFIPMTNIMDGIPAVAKQGYNRMFEWRQDRIYMPGSQNSMDLRIRFASFFPDFQTQGAVQWYQQPVPIMRCLDAFADYICVEASVGRDDVSGGAFEASAEGKAKLIFNRDVRLKNRTNVRRRPRSGGHGHHGAAGLNSF